MFEFTLDDHPARQSVNGIQTPVVVDILSIRVKGDDGRFYLCGYVNKNNGNTTLLKKYPQTFEDELKVFLKDLVGAAGTLSSAAALTDDREGYDDEF